MNKLHCCFPALSVLFLTLSSAVQADINVKKGMWEINNKINVTGVPIKIPDTKVSQCIDKQTIVPKSDKKINKYCKVIEQTIHGDTVSWKMSCSNKMESHGSITYHGDTFEGTVSSTMVVPAMGSMLITNHMTGKRTGECK